jgi:hypothetical protein
MSSIMPTNLRGSRKHFVSTLLGALHQSFVAGSGPRTFSLWSRTQENTPRLAAGASWPYADVRAFARGDCPLESAPSALLPPRGSTLRDEPKHVWARSIKYRAAIYPTRQGADKRSECDLVAVVLQCFHNISCVERAPGPADDLSRLARRRAMFERLRTTSTRLPLAHAACWGGISISHNGSEENLRLFQFCPERGNLCLLRLDDREEVASGHGEPDCSADCDPLRQPRRMRLSVSEPCRPAALSPS